MKHHGLLRDMVFLKETTAEGSRPAWFAAFLNSNTVAKWISNSFHSVLPSMKTCSDIPASDPAVTIALNILYLKLRILRPAEHADLSAANSSFGNGTFGQE